MIPVIQLLLLSVNALDCTLQIPANPTSATGLSTPYILSGKGCTQSNPDAQTFVEAAIFDPATNTVSVYHPLVITQGTTPAIPPVAVTLPANAVVGVWFGTNADSITFQGAGAAACVNGLPNDIFGQFGYCNAPAFFKAANGKVAVPDLGVGLDGKPCPTTRDFRVVDQDQSDNLVTSYLLTKNGQVAQKTVANIKALGNATEFNNGSDNLLLNFFFQPLLKCQGLTAVNLADPQGPKVNALALNELQAAAKQQQPIALVPVNDPMVTTNGVTNIDKLNLYRAGVNMPPVKTAQEADAKQYCTTYIQQFTTLFDQKTMALLLPGQTPDATAGNNLFNFLGSRFSSSLDELKCAQFKLVNPLVVKTDGKQIAIGVNLNNTALALDGAKVAAAVTTTIMTTTTLAGAKTTAAATTTTTLIATANPGDQAAPTIIPSGATSLSSLIVPVLVASILFQ